MTDPALDDLIARLPKAELHLHLVGAASPETVLRLTERHPDADVPRTPEALERFYAFRDFEHFLEVYVAVNALVTTPDDVVDLVVGAARDAAACGVRWAEVTVTAAAHLQEGIAAPDLVRALADGRDAARRDHGVDLGWIVDVPAGLGDDVADVTLAFLRDHLPEGTVAVGLAGFEDGYPRVTFAEPIAAARAFGLPAVIHAGETTGPEEVWSAVRDLHADRVAHGLGAARDPELLAYLAAEAIPLDVCVTSNLRTGAVPSLSAHPLPALLAAGVTVDLGTDDPGMFATDLNAEYRTAADLAGLDAAGVVALARNAVTASLAPTTVRDDLLAAIAELNQQ